MVEQRHIIAARAMLWQMMVGGVLLEQPQDINKFETSIAKILVKLEVTHRYEGEQFGTKVAEATLESLTARRVTSRPPDSVMANYVFTGVAEAAKVCLEQSAILIPGR